MNIETSHFDALEMLRCQASEIEEIHSKILIDLRQGRTDKKRVVLNYETWKILKDDIKVASERFKIFTQGWDNIFNEQIAENNKMQLEIAKRMKEDKKLITNFQNQIQILQEQLKDIQKQELQIKNLQESLKNTQNDNRDLKNQIRSLYQIVIDANASFEKDISNLEKQYQNQSKPLIKIDFEIIEALKLFDSSQNEDFLKSQLQNNQIPVAIQNLRLNIADQIDSSIKQDLYSIPPTDRPQNYVQKNAVNQKVSSRSQTPHLYEGENRYQYSPSLISNDYEISHPSVFNQDGSQYIHPYNQEEIQLQVEDIIQEETCTQQESSSIMDEQNQLSSKDIYQYLISNQTEYSDIPSHSETKQDTQSENNTQDHHSNSHCQEKSPGKSIIEIQKALKVVKKLGLLESKNQPILSQVCEIMNDSEQTGQLELVMQLINLNRLKLPDQKVLNQLKDPSPKKILISPSNQRKPPTPRAKNSSNNLQLSQLQQLIQMAQQGHVQQQQL